MAGAVFTPTTNSFIAGRHEAAELRFDRQRDTTVSARHAGFQQSSGGWSVRDLGSKNGLLVNGQVVSGEVRLESGDRVMFGPGGPEVEVLADRPAPEPASTRLRTAVRPRKRFAAMIGGVAAGVSLVVAVVLTVRATISRRAFEGERRVLNHLIDSLTAAAGGDQVELLRRQLSSATAALGRQQLTADLDFATIQRRARGAVAMLWVEFPDGHRVSGTAFVVRANGALLTSRHIVTGADGAGRPRRIAVRFADSDQTFPAHLVLVSPNWELALVQAENIVGDIPATVLNARADTLSPGSPVVLIGYPLGGEPEREPASDRRIARPVVSAGLLLRSTPAEIEVQGLGAAGASGSPILDASGNVAALLYGGRTQDGVEILSGVPARAIAEFLASSSR